ncbi:flagellar biosynthesis protein FlgA [Paenibacillus pinisoli]|uniref:Flagellar biosynthesis protein FlgA n=1 Tax=Paenibacillus pinisoli TaxID=1276110 RepID=A0A3A6PES8_9BACL|nr:SAF domain-containing protein [Paenibacillus pinisoli]RJX38650.1 flagellar biosynthesis protein FlgA [Paenibacillus pinisoli]
MRRGSSLWLSLTAAALSAALVYGLYVVQRDQLEQQETVAVVVPNRFIAAGERIEREDLELRRLPVAAYTLDMVSKIDAASGMEAAMPLGKGEALLSWKLNEHYLHPRTGESTFQIPREYIRSVSNGIRAGDRVALYASGAEEESLRIFPEPVIVASVKSSANVEVDSLKQSHLMSLVESNMEGMYAARRDANAMIEYVNLNLTEAQWLRIDRLCKGGSVKIVIAYSPESYDRMKNAREAKREGEGRERDE